MIINKYIVPFIKDFQFEFHQGAQVLKIMLSANGDGLRLWVVVDPEKPLTRRKFRVFGTGDPLDGNLMYINTVEQKPLGYIWHIFEELPAPKS